MIASPAKPIATENSRQKLRPSGVGPTSSMKSGVATSRRYTPIQKAPCRVRFMG